MTQSLFKNILEWSESELDFVSLREKYQIKKSFKNTAKLGSNLRELKNKS